MMNSFSVTERMYHMKEYSGAVCLGQQRQQSGRGARLLPLAGKLKVLVALRDRLTS